MSVTKIQDIQKLISCASKQTFEYQEQELRQEVDKELNERLIQVLDEESKQKAPEHTPFMKEKFFKEMFTQKLMPIHGADISSSSEDQSVGQEAPEYTSADEESFMAAQRQYFKGHVDKKPKLANKDKAYFEIPKKNQL